MVIVKKVLPYLAVLLFGVLVGAKLLGNQVQQSTKDNHENYKTELKQSKKQYRSLSKKYDKLLASTTEKVNDSKLQKFFETIYTYNNHTYMQRYEDAKKYGSDQAISLFKIEAGNTHVPTSVVESSLDSVTLYLKPNSTKEGIVIVTSTYSYQEQTTPITVTYNVTLGEDNDVQKLTVANYGDN